MNDTTFFILILSAMFIGGLIIGALMGFGQGKASVLCASSECTDCYDYINQGITTCTEQLDYCQTKLDESRTVKEAVYSDLVKCVDAWKNAMPKLNSSCSWSYSLTQTLGKPYALCWNNQNFTNISEVIK